MSIEKLLKSKDRLIIGKKEVLKKLKLGLINEVLVANNCPDKFIEELTSAAKFSNADVKKLELNNEELAAQLKKLFNISVVGVKKEK